MSADAALMLAGRVGRRCGGTGTAVAEEERMNEGGKGKGEGKTLTLLRPLFKAARVAMVRRPPCPRSVLSKPARN